MKKSDYNLEEKKLKYKVLSYLKKRYHEDPFEWINSTALLDTFEITERENMKIVKFLEDDGLIEAKWFIGGGFLCKITPQGLHNLEKKESYKKRSEKPETRPSEEIFDETEEKFSIFLKDNLNGIYHPYTKQREVHLEKEDIQDFLDLFFKFLRIEIKNKKVAGLRDRILNVLGELLYEGFTDKHELTKIYERLYGNSHSILRKLAFINFENNEIFKFYLPKLINKISGLKIDFNKDLTQSEKASITSEEAHLRLLHKHKNIESHETQDYDLQTLQHLIWVYFGCLYYLITKRSSEIEKYDTKDQKISRIRKIFSTSFKEWKRNNILIGEQQLKYFLKYKDEIKPNKEEVEFLIRCCIYNYWIFFDSIFGIFPNKKLSKTCKKILKEDKNDIEIKSNAIFVLGKIKSENPRFFIDFMKKTEEGSLIRVCAIVLGDDYRGSFFEEKDVLDLLDIFRRTEDYKARREIMYAIGEIEFKEKEKIKNLICNGLKDSRAPVRAQTTLTISSKNYNDLLEHVHTTFIKERSKFPEEMISAIGEMGDKTSIEILKKKKNEVDPSIHYMIDKVIEKIEERIRKK